MAMPGNNIPSSMDYYSVRSMADPEILYNSEYVGKAITLSANAFGGAQAVPAGAPINEKGLVANDDTAIGILLHTVYANRPQGTIVIGGYINGPVAADSFGSGIQRSAIEAMKNVVFVNYAGVSQE